jgi:hypothetical protein
MQKRLSWRLWWGMAESAFGGGVKWGGRFDVGMNPTSVAVKKFSHLIYFNKKFYKYCNCNAVFKNNTAAK